MSKETFERYTLTPHPERVFIKPRKMTKFKAKWGIHAIDLAEREQCSPDAIHMRIRNFGTPWQRRSKPTTCEELTGYTSNQLAKKLDLHPYTIDTRIKKFNNPYYKENNATHDYDYNEPGRTHWTKKDPWQSDWRAWHNWLMPEHPCWAEWKAQKELDNQKLQLDAVIKRLDKAKHKDLTKAEFTAMTTSILEEIQNDKN